MSLVSRRLAAGGGVEPLQGYLCRQPRVGVLADLRETSDEAVWHVWITWPLTPMEVLAAYFLISDESESRETLPH